MRRVVVEQIHNNTVYNFNLNISLLFSMDEFDTIICEKLYLDLIGDECEK